MRYTTLGNTDIEVSVMTLGCWPFGGVRFWGAQDDADSIATVHAALDAGINFFDTARSYGESERVLGAALASRRHDHGHTLAVPRVASDLVVDRATIHRWPSLAPDWRRTV